MKREKMDIEQDMSAEEPSKKQKNESFSDKLFELANNSKWQEITNLSTTDSSIPLQDLDVIKHDSITLLNLAAQAQQWDFVKLLLEKGAKNLDAIPQEGPNRGITALWYAAAHNQWDLVKLLLEKGAKNLDATPQEGPNRGITALWYAAAHKQWDLVKLLLEKGAKNLDATPQEGPNRGKTALWNAANHMQWDLVKLLLEKGAKNLDATPQEGPNRGITVLLVVAAHNQWDLVKLLFEKGAKNLDATPQEGPNRGITALWCAAADKQWDLAKLLLEKGAKNLDATPEEDLNRGKTALWYAANHKQWDLVKLLLEKCAKNLDATPQEGPYRGITALWYAAAHKQWDLVKLLLEKCAKNLDATPQEGPYRGITALWSAAAHKQWDLVKLLLEKGAKNLDATSQEGHYQGKTALYFAINQDKQQIITLLFQYKIKYLENNNDVQNHFLSDLQQTKTKPMAMLAMIAAYCAHGHNIIPFLEYRLDDNDKPVHAKIKVLSNILEKYKHEMVQMHDVIQSLFNEDSGNIIYGFGKNFFIDPNKLIYNSNIPELNGINQKKKNDIQDIFSSLASKENVVRNLLKDNTPSLFWSKLDNPKKFFLVITSRMRKAKLEKEGKNRFENIETSNKKLDSSSWMNIYTQHFLPVYSHATLGMPGKFNCTKRKEVYNKIYEHGQVSNYTLNASFFSNLLVDKSTSISTSSPKI